jgi:hypothetical protein
MVQYNIILISCLPHIQHFFICQKFSTDRADFCTEAAETACWIGKTFGLEKEGKSAKSYMMTVAYYSACYLSYGDNLSL